MKKVIFCLYKALFKTIEDDGVEHAGYMSFMVLLSLFPFIIFLLAFTGFIGASELGKYFVTFFLENLPKDAAFAIEDRIKEILNAPPQSLMTLAIIGTIWTASSFVEGLRTILNRIYGVSSPPTYITRRLLSILQFILFSLLINFTVFLFIFIPIALNKMPIDLNIINLFSFPLTYIKYGLLFLLLFSSIALLYYIIPNIRLKFRNIVPGALLTSIFWIASGSLISNYIAHYNQLSLIYGSLGSIIITLLFFYIINIIFIYGAEFNRLYEQTKGEENNK